MRYGEIDINEIAGLPCPGCGVGDQLEIFEIDYDYAYISDGKVYHNIECYEMDQSTIIEES